MGVETIVRIVSHILLTSLSKSSPHPPQPVIIAYGRHFHPLQDESAQQAGADDLLISKQKAARTGQLRAGGSSRESMVRALDC